MTPQIRTSALFKIAPTTIVIGAILLKQPVSRYFIVGMMKSEPVACSTGQRVVSVLSFV